MVEPNRGKSVSAVFITFSGNCKQALTHYQTCFGGTVQFELFGKALPGYAEVPVVNGSLLSDRIVIRGSDLVHNEGRTLGNYMAIFLPCKNVADRESLIDKLGFNEKGTVIDAEGDRKLIEITDAFDVRWVLGVD